MVVDRSAGTRVHANVADIRDFIPSGSVMVFNNSRVRKARVYAYPEGSHDSQEFLLIRRTTALRWLTLARNARRLKVGKQLRFPDGVGGTVVNVVHPYREIEFDREIDDSWLEEHGHVPLPPYIERADSPFDMERYQTVYAETIGSVAAPTAWLHFTPGLLDVLRDHGVDIRFVTLHVGIGTFLPVRTTEVETHEMHAEEYYVSPSTAAACTEALERGRPLTAVGTTAVRTLESAWSGDDGRVHSGHRSTDLYIYPGYTFNVVRHLFTNFHTPKSSLVLLVSAFAGRDTILRSYREAIEKRYRFFSYGDAMLLL